MLRGHILPASAINIEDRRPGLDLYPLKEARKEGADKTIIILATAISKCRYNRIDANVRT